MKCVCLAAAGMENDGQRRSWRDSTYYISDGNVVFLVEGTLFKVELEHLTCLYS
jgi:hypothetical protein